MRFRTEKNRSIVFCILDITDDCKSGYAKEICVNLTDFLINRCDLHDHDILISKDENALIKTAADEGYAHAVLISAGTSLGLSDRLFEAVDNQCKEDFFIAGHILDRGENSFYKKNACFELHKQFYIINLDQYKELGSPTIGNEEWVQHQQIAPVRSKEFLYDDPEIPVWIKQGVELKTYSVKLHGWNIINTALENDRKLITLNQQIRSSKKYLYYEHDHVFLRQLEDIKYHQFFCNNFFAGWNSDRLKLDLPFNGPVEQYASVGIGFNWIKNLETVGFTNETKVIFTDINHNCLMFMKKMVEEWDGKNYADFYWNNKPMLPNNPPYIPDTYKDQIAEQWNKFLETFDEWDLHWSRVKNLKYDYILIDYTASFNFNWLEEDKKTLLNLSDLYNHAPFIASLSLKYRISCENNLLQKLKKKDPNITLITTSRAADGFWRSNGNKRIDIADNFIYTNIAELKTPEWHKEDWKHHSDRPLGVK